MVQEGSGPLKGKGKLQLSHRMAASMSTWAMLLLQPAFAVDSSTGIYHLCCATVVCMPLQALYKRLA